MHLLICSLNAFRRSILFPREHSESFVSDSLKFIFVMLVACIALFVWAAVVLATVSAYRGSTALMSSQPTLAFSPAFGLHVDTESGSVLLQH